VRRSRDRGAPACPDQAPSKTSQLAPLAAVEGPPTRHSPSSTKRLCHRLGARYHIYIIYVYMYIHIFMFTVFEGPTPKKIPSSTTHLFHRLGAGCVGVRVCGREEKSKRKGEGVSMYIYVYVHVQCPLRTYCAQPCLHMCAGRFDQLGYHQ